MSILKKLFNTNAETKKDVTANVHWVSITDISQLDALTEASKAETVLIFKHSTRCGISKMVFRQFEKSFKTFDKIITVYYLDLLNYREISDEIAARFQVFHQSPQLIVLKNGVMVANASHYDILELEYVSLI
ncbi:MAG: bacillithiol system redox-active protein YtxJ [Polaribacter sp.]|nr:bacillithiol system redox-active protein YtxJ [Polaribacter sp.]MDG1811954.1 bacillithiol system redox-active protein YtxJ [Polaribacter sp.]MDG1992990.1 bacillithiol system redox-active protein YtxJ [Polaribacter sp.]